MMKQLVSILIFVFSLAFPGGVSPQADVASFSLDTPEIQQASGQSTSSEVLFRLFASHQQAETGSKTADTLIDSSVDGDSQEDFVETAIQETSVQQHAALLLSLSRVHEHSLTIKRLIYPSHYFL